MGALKSERLLLKATLKDAGIPTVTEYIPEKTHAPCAMIVFGEPYLENGDVFGSTIVRYEIDLMPRPSTNSKLTDDIEQYLEDVLPHLVEDGYQVDRVQQPRTRNTNNAQYLVLTVSVSKTIII